MNLITNVTSDTLQTQKIILADGSQALLTLNFKPMQYGWFINELSYGNVTINGMRVCVSPNILFQFKNQLPFGIACFSTASREPSQQNDFVSGNANLYLLTAAEVNDFSEFISGG